MSIFLRISKKLKTIAISIFFACGISFSLLGTSVFLAKADSITQNIVAPETGFNQVTHYEFNNWKNLGKDSLGNYDLVAQHIAFDDTNGGVALKNGGLFCAQSLDENKVDFSDLMQGSFSLSMRIYIRSCNDWNNYLISTGSWGSHFTVGWTWYGLEIYLGNEQSLAFGTQPEGTLGEKAMFDEVFSWYRIHMIYDEREMTFRVIATKESDETYSYDATAQLSQQLTFGGSEDWAFTVGAQSHFGGWIDQQADTILPDGTKIYPSISDLRIYSGIIDNAEIAAISEYDVDNLENRDDSFDTEPDLEDFEGIAHYEFTDAGNLGKDSLGNYNLISQSLSIDKKNGGISFKDGGLLYAPALDANKTDFSDLITGSFSISMRVYIRSCNDWANYLISTGAWGSHFTVGWTWYGLEIYLGNEKTLAFGTLDGYLGEKLMFDQTFAWYRINLIYDESELTFRVITTKLNDDDYLFDCTAKLTEKLAFGGSEDRTFTLGAQSHFGGWVGQEANAVLSDGTTIYPNISDLRLYSGTINNTEIKKITETDDVFIKDKLSYIVEFLNPCNGFFEDVKINDEAYNGEKFLKGEVKTLTFKLNVNTGYAVSSVAVNNKKVIPDVNGVYTVEVSDYVLMSAQVLPLEYTITYVLNNGQGNEEQAFGYAEIVQLADYFIKEGYVFEGWYDNAELTGEKISAIDTQSMTDITLYAKWLEKVEEPVEPDNSDNSINSDETPSATQQGCAGTLGGITVGLPLFMIGLAVMMKRRKD